MNDSNSSLLPTPRRKNKKSLLAALSAIVLIASTASEEAQACGGFFCSAAAPVNQAAERIIFADNGDGTITSIIQIIYEGPSENFAWVLPVAGNPEVDVSSSQAFDRLQSATNPTYRFNNTVQTDGCEQISAGAGGASTGMAGAGNVPRPPPLVTVLQSGSVGPFDFEVIEVDLEDQDPADAAVRWLSINGYDVTATTPAVLRPYLENGLNLVAFRLQKGKDSGSLRPVSLTYESARAAIPVIPTSVAASDDMGITVWILGGSRAVPINYKGLELNELLIDWFDPTSNYDEVVSIAADEANGHGFVTEFSGTTEGFTQPIVLRTSKDEEVWGQITSETDHYASIELAASYFGSFDGFADAANETLALREGVTMDDFIACVPCYFNGFSSLKSHQEAGSPDLVRAADQEDAGEGSRLIAQDDPIYQARLSDFVAALETQVIKPLWDIANLFETSDHITRLYTTMSASEMTVDPMFDFNPDLPEVSNLHVLDRTINACGGDWTVTLDDGTTISGVGNIWPYTTSDISEDFPAAAQIMEYSTEGPGTFIVDKTDEIDTLVATGVVGSSTGGATSTEEGGATSSGSTSGSGASDTGGVIASSGDTPDEVDDAGCAYSQGGPARGKWGLFGAAFLGGMVHLRRRRGTRIELPLPPERC